MTASVHTRRSPRFHDDGPVGAPLRAAAALRAVLALAAVAALFGLLLLIGLSQPIDHVDAPSDGALMPAALAPAAPRHA